MTNEQKSNIQALVRALAGFCTHEGPENFLNALVAKLVEGEFDEALVEEAWGWIKDFETETYED